MMPDYGNQNGGIKPPSYRRNIPRYESHHGKSTSCCLRCICCCCCSIVIVILVLTALAFYLYSIYIPKMPSYQVDSIDVKAFDMQPDLSLLTELLVNVKAENPNRHISFIYGKDNLMSVFYTNTNLCSGKIPAFHQGHQNTTVMRIDLKGKSDFDSGLEKPFAENRHHGRIPLLIKVEVPVEIVLEGMPLRPFLFAVNCSLVVDSLTPNKTAEILSSDYTMSFRW